MENKTKTNTTENILERLEAVMLEEIDFYTNKETSISLKTSRLNVTDRIVKSAGTILAVENLKERRFMNRTERKDLTRKIEKQNT